MPARGGELRLWTTHELPGVEVRIGRDVVRPAPLHFHGNYEVGLVEGGAAHFTHRGRVHLAGPGDLVLISPGEPHAIEVPADRPCSFRALHLPEALVADLGLQLPRFSVAPAQDALARDLRRLFDLLTGAASVEDPLGRIRQALAPLRCCELAAGGPAGASPTRPAVRRAQEHLEASLDTRVSLEELGRLTGLSRFHLARAFTAEVGMPPHAYLAQVRVLFAKTLVRAGYPLREVAARCGFADQSHLSREFKRLTQVTPGGYARALRGFR